MSEYIEIESELSDDGEEIFIYTNLRLGDRGSEAYDTLSAMEEGSPLAQTLAPIEGIVQLRIEDMELIIGRDPDVEWTIIVEEVSAALKDFFL